MITQSERPKESTFKNLERKKYSNALSVTVGGTSEQCLPPKGWAAAAAAKSLQSCPTLCDPIDGSPPGSAVPGILQARTWERVAMSFSSA